MNLMSEQIDQLATALAKAQGEMPIAIKNAKNPFFKSMYADFESIVMSSRPSLSKYGLSISQPPFIVQPDGSLSLITMLLHSSGQWIKSVAPHNPPKEDIQSLSSYNTYLKRMCYTNIVGVATGEEDDDGEAATIPYRNESNYRQTVHIAPYNDRVESLTEDQLRQIEYELDGYQKIAKTIMDGLNIGSLSGIPRSQFLKVFNRARELVQIEKSSNKQA